MSDTKQIRTGGMHDEDLVELLYYTVLQHASILNYLSTVGSVISCIIGSFSAQSTTTILSISALATFPNSITARTGVSISLL